jgi:uncharacterized protein
MASTPLSLPFAKGKDDIAILPRMANRHGLIAGATDTGKTVTLRVLAEAFSGIGVPIFMADIKGDLSGLPKPGGETPKVSERLQKISLRGFSFEGYPTDYFVFPKTSFRRSVTLAAGFVRIFCSSWPKT